MRRGDPRHLDTELYKRRPSFVAWKPLGHALGLQIGMERYFGFVIASIGDPSVTPTHYLIVDPSEHINATSTLGC
jgi:hypothetical protein